MSIGVPVCNTDVRVVTDAGDEARPGEIGEFVIAGPQVIPGYWQKPQETAASLRNGELRTGDVGFMDEAGLVLSRRPGQGHDRRVGFQGLAPGSRGGALPASRRARGRRRRRSRPVSRGNHQGGGQPQGRVRRDGRTRSRRSPASGWRPTSIRASSRSSTNCRRRRAARSCAGSCSRRLAGSTSSMHGGESEFATVSYPQLRAAVEARAVLEVGATWLRLSRGPIPHSTSEALYERLRLMLAQIGEGGRFLDRDAFLAANEAYHAAVIDLAENEYLSQGFRQLRLRELYATALKDTPATPEGVVSLHEHLTDSIAASDATGALKAILSWGETARASVHVSLGGDTDSAQAGDDLRPAGVVEDLSLAKAKEQSSREGDVDALVMALDARAALEIGITQSLGGSLTTDSRPRRAGDAAARVHAAGSRRRRGSRLAVHPGR